MTNKEYSKLGGWDAPQGNAATPPFTPLPSPVIGHYASYSTPAPAPKPMEDCQCDICNICNIAPPAPVPCYVVLSVDDLRRMLKRAVANSKATHKRTKGYSTTSFQSHVIPGSRGELQINSYEISK